MQTSATELAENLRGQGSNRQATQRSNVQSSSQSGSVSDTENCVGCQFVWAKVNAMIDQSAGYEAVKDAFERACANMPDVFYDAVSC